MNLPSDTLNAKLRAEPAFKAGYISGLADAHTIVGSHIAHAETVEEAKALDAISRAIHAMLMAYR